MDRPKGRDLQAGEVIAKGDYYHWPDGEWTETIRAGERVHGNDVGDYVRPESVNVPVAVAPLDSLSSPEPAPTDGEGPAIWDLVVEDMRERDAFGREKYGRPLRAHDGRRTLRDAYQEALDLAVYLRRAIYEAEGR